MLAIFCALGVVMGVRQGLPVLTQQVPDAVARGAAQIVGRPAPAMPMELAIELPARNENGLRAVLQALYDPASPEFRHYLRVGQFTAYYGPTESDYRALVQFALANNLHPHRFAANRRVLDVQGATADVERAFHVKIGLYRLPTGSRTFFAPDREPTLDLGTRVLAIEGLDDATLPVSRRIAARAGAMEPDAPISSGSGPSGAYLGSDMRAAYYGGTALAGSGQTVGLFEFEQYNLDSVKHYFDKFGQINRVPIVGESINGVDLYCVTYDCDDESSTDIEEVLSVAPALKELVVYVGKSDVSILNQMASDDSANQLSNSNGFGAVNPDALNPIFEELAAQGQSFLSATADDGYKLNDVWPSDDQYVTAVGGTDVVTNGPGGSWRREVGWRESGGGPSPNHIAIPDYQTTFINMHNMGSTKFRNVPDVAANARLYFNCAVDVCDYGVGTSYAAPIWTAFVALTNQYGAISNRPPVGFLNPVMYRLAGKPSYPDVFHDIVDGYNGKFAAYQGYDLVTGLGTPDGEPLMQALVHGS